jgi:hypothetical protein
MSLSIYIPLRVGIDMGAKFIAHTVKLRMLPVATNLQLRCRCVCAMLCVLCCVCYAVCAVLWCAVACYAGLCCAVL